jgi:formylglycine-generating enzyme required for sulfatase activity
MRFIQGKTLAEAIQAYHAQPTLLAFHALLKRFLDVCQTMAYAHSRGVIHRDLKPANVMLGDYGETLVVDWGLAKRVGGPEAQPTPDREATPPAGESGAGSAELTEAGQVLGTPAYMSPEQAEGRADGIGPATDIYALGAILYELLTGQPPYRGPGLGAVLAQVRQGPPPSPAHVRRGVPRALEAVCLKAMARAPADRYAGAAEVAREVERWLADEPVAAYREPLPVQLSRWGRRHRTLVTAVVLVLLTLVGAAIIGGLVVGREQERAGALAQADALPGAAPAAVPALLKDLAAHRDTVRPRLLARWQDPALTDGQRLRVGLALADDVDVRARLIGLARKADDPQEVLLVRDALVPYGAEVGPLLWGEVAQPATPARERLRLLGVLASLDPNSGCWKDASAEVVGVLAREDVLLIGGWAEALRSVRGHLVPHLVRRLVRAEASGYPALLAILSVYREEAVPELETQLEQITSSSPEQVERLALAHEQAKAAVALLHLERAVHVWPLFHQEQDPTRRTYLIHECAALGVDPAILARRVKEDGVQDPSRRQGLLLALGEYSADQREAVAQGPMTDWVPSAYRNDPDPGVHSAAGWLLRRWGMMDRLARIDQELTRTGARWQLGEVREPRWCVSPDGQPFAVIPVPGAFDVGAARDERPRFPGELDRRRVRIDYSYALALRPVTVAEFKQYKLTFEHDARYSPGPDTPINMVSWYDAVAYCNWLSAQEKIPEDQWCYEPNSKGEYAQGMGVKPDYLELSGYRLPREAEWEFACRAGTVTAWSHGSDEALLGQYAWYAVNSSSSMHPVGGLKPNGLGFFDLEGNTWQWCQDAAEGKDEKDQLQIRDDPHRVLRGGSSGGVAALERCAFRNTDFGPSYRDSYCGFRVARTYR